MTKMCRCLLALMLAMVLLQTGAGAQDEGPAAGLVPADAVFCVEATRPRAILDLLTGEEMTEALNALPSYRELFSAPGFAQFQLGVSHFELLLNASWRDALKRLTGDGITFALCPDESVLLIIEAEDEAFLARFHETLINAVRADAVSKGLPPSVESAEYMGVTGWSLDGKEAHATVGKRLILSSTAEGLKRALELRAEANGASFASRPDYVKAQRVSGPVPDMRAFASIAPFKQMPGVAQLLAPNEDNPLAALFFSGLMEAANNANWLWLGLGANEEGLSLRALLDGQVAGQASPAAFAQPPTPAEGAMPNLCVPGRIASLSFYRDLYGFYSGKDALFGERTSPLIFFENMMGIFFTGRDLTSEVLSETRPELRFVVAQEQLDQGSDPDKGQMPAFAAVLRLRDPEAFGVVVEEAWQKAVGLVNFTSGQQAQPGLIIDRPIHGGTKYTVAGLSSAGLDSPNAHHNARPTLAMPGDYVILSSTDGLARHLMDALSAEGAGAPVGGVHSMVELDGGQLGSILEANRAVLARNTMVSKGVTEEEAEAEVRVYFDVASAIECAKLRVGTSNGLTEGCLDIELALPERQAP